VLGCQRPLADTPPTPRIYRHGRTSPKRTLLHADRVIGLVATLLAATSMTFPRKRLVRDFTSRLRGNALSCRVASTDWRPGRVYFLTLLEPLAGTTGLWPLPPSRPVRATVGALSTTVDWFTAHAADRVIPCLTLWDLAIASTFTRHVCPARRSCLFRSPSFRRLRRTR
jgi:hypothetical protein